MMRERGQRGLVVQNVYRMLYQRNLYLCAYGKLYKNEGAMTEGSTTEIVDGMTLEKIDKIITLLRNERYRWTPVRRTYIPKKKGSAKFRVLGLPTWSDKLLQEVIRLILEAYYEPQFSAHSYGFRPNRGCHTALRKVVQKGRGTKWYIEGDIASCFDRIDHSILIKIISEKFQDNRFIRLLNGLLKAGYLEDWKFNKTHSGVPAGSIVGPVLSNIVLDRLDKYVENQIIPKHTRGRRRKTNPAYARLKKQECKARIMEDWKMVKILRQKAQAIPSRDPNDSNYRRLWYCRYADDFLLGLIGTKSEAVTIKYEILKFLQESLNLELNVEKTLVTHARDERAKFLGYEIHTMHRDSKHDRRGQRCINGGVGLRVPIQIKREKCARYMKHGKPEPILPRKNGEAYSIVAQYQAEYRGIVQYYKMAYNLHVLSYLKRVIELSLVKTLASKYKTTCAKIYKRYGTTVKTQDGEYKVILVEVKREPPKKPLIAYFGGVSLKWNKWVNVNDSLKETVWNKRNELVRRLLAQECELCGSQENVEVHHIKKLASLKQNNRIIPEWKKWMLSKQRKTLVVCQACHNDIHYGRYDGKGLKREYYWRAS